MSLVRWFTHNRADTREPTHPDLGPLTLAGPVPDAVRMVRAAVAKLPRWDIVAADEAAGTLHTVRRTWVFRFVDDVRLSFEPAGGGKTVVHAESRSRIGKGDLGQNRRNVLELWKAVSSQLSAVSPQVTDH